MEETLTIRIKPISQNEWCILLIFATQQEVEFYEHELNDNDFETYLLLKGTLLTIVIDIPKMSKVIRWDSIKITSVQTYPIINQKVTEISFSCTENYELNDTHCRYANVRYPKY